MQIKSLFQYIWKIPLCGLLFFIGFIPGGWLATQLGFSTPELPMGADQGTVVLFTLIGSLLLALGLSAVARGLSGGFLARWLMLFFFTWMAYGVNTYLEASIFSTMAAASLYTVIIYLPASLFCAAAVAWLFPSNLSSFGFVASIQAFFAGRTLGDWTWRLLAAFLAFPVAYTIFGMLISPIVLPYYQQGSNELALPGWGQILPILALRSLFFILVCLPILITWRLSNIHLFLSLGLALFILVGGLGMLSAYWLPPILRITHSLEIFADEMIYAAALVLLLRRQTAQPTGEQVPLPIG